MAPEEPLHDLMDKVHPLCFSPRIFDLWEKANRSSTSAACRSHCRDCMPSYQLRMKKLKRCEHPETMFIVEDGGVVGLT